jgi:hypothetical protein
LLTWSQGDLGPILKYFHQKNWRKISVFSQTMYCFLLPNFPGFCTPWVNTETGQMWLLFVLCQESGTNQYWYQLLWHPILSYQFFLKLLLVFAKKLIRTLVSRNALLFAKNSPKYAPFRRKFAEMRPFSPKIGKNRSKL